MQRGKSTGHQSRPRKVWRISPSTPLGEFVDPGLELPPEPQDPLVAESDGESIAQRGWLMSSFELLNGVEVSEEDPSTVPAELFDELFRKPK